MRGDPRTYLRRRPVPPGDRARIERRVAELFPAWVPSPIREILWVKRLDGHLGARVLLFDGVPALLILEAPVDGDGEVRWVYRGLPAHLDDRPFFYHRMRAAWMRDDGPFEEAARRHGRNLV